MKRKLDPRVEPLLDKWMTQLEFGAWVYALKPLSKKWTKECWARCCWNHLEKHVEFEFGPTVGLSDENLESIVVHEVCHGITQLAMSTVVGSVADEQLCNMLARQFVPAADRPFPYISTVQPKWADMAKYFGDEEREALEDIMPSLIIRLPEPQRSTLLALFYDGKSLREVAAERGVHHKSIERYRDAGLAAIRQMFLDGA